MQKEIILYRFHLGFESESLSLAEPFQRTGVCRSTFPAPLPRSGAVVHTALPCLYVGAGDPNSRPQACVISCLPPGSSLQYHGSLFFLKGSRPNIISAHEAFVTSLPHGFQNSRRWQMMNRHYCVQINLCLPNRHLTHDFKVIEFGMIHYRRTS